MTDLELFIRKRLGQKDLNQRTGWIDDDYIRTEHLRFDMAFGAYTSYKEDPILGLFHDVLGDMDQYIVKFWKGGCTIYKTGYEIDKIFEPESGLGTVDIIKKILIHAGSKIPKDEMRDIKLNLILK
jgi:hypothetical protein